MKKVTLLLFSIFLIANMFAGEVIPPETARQVAQNFMIEKFGQSRFQATDFLLEDTETDENGEALYYRFQVGNKGFIMVSATDLIHPVLAFSMESNFANMCGASLFSTQYKEDIRFAKAHPELSAGQAKAAWAHLSATPQQAKAGKSGDSKSDTYIKGIEPLCTNTWNQSPYYNMFTPFCNTGGKSDPNNAGNKYRSATGCVSLAMSNLLYYYRYPAQGLGGISYKLGNFGYRIEEHFYENTYNYDAMSDHPSDFEGEVAKLIYHIGTSCETQYGASSSSNGYTATEALKQFWQYSSDANYQMYTNTVSTDDDVVYWVNMLVKELDARRPVYYDGAGEVDTSSGGPDCGGHAWVVDGYIMEADSTYYFHCNWGWGGVDNGFFQINKFNTNQCGFFNRGQGLMLGMMPTDTSLISKPAVSKTRNTAYSGSICDGAGNMEYKNNSRREWMVAAPNARSYTFDFRKIKTEKDNDVITIYNGPTTASGIAIQLSGNYLMPACGDYPSFSGYASHSGATPTGHKAEFAGDPLPGSITVSADSVLIVFTSNDTITDYGFNINYTATPKVSPYCTSSSQTYTESQYPRGRISDRGLTTIADAPEYLLTNSYVPRSDCQWNLRRTDASANYYFYFIHFDLATGDVLDIFDTRNTQKPELLYRFDSKHRPDGIYELPGRVKVQFVTDNWQEGPGFELEFTTNRDDPGFKVSEWMDLTNVSIYPNPVSQRLHTSLTTSEPGNIAFTLMDITGKTMLSENVPHNGGTLKHDIAVNNLTSGLYILRVQTNKGQITKKIIVQ